MSETPGPSEQWSAVAAAWDANVDQIHCDIVPAISALVARLAVQPGERVLELAAGPGSLGSTWSDLVGPSGAVVLSDIAPAMVEAAARRNAARDNLEVMELDLSSIDRPDGSADVVACCQGLMFTHEPAEALAEIHRVLATGGRFGALTWGGIEHNPWMSCVGMAAMANGIVSGGPPVGPGGIFSLGDPAELEALAKGAGFVDVVVEEQAVEFRADSIDAHVARVSSLAGPLAGAFAGASDDQLAAVRRTAADLAAPYVTPDGLCLPGRALLVSGRR